jgi:hypothetical protein
MIGSPTTSRGNGRGATILLCATLFLIVCIGPHLRRLRRPSLYTDDVVRVARLQAIPLGRLMFLPFNEHMAPVFELVSWVTWRLAGRRLADAPLAFTLASYVPFLLSLGLLGRLVRRETGSATTARVALAAFSCSWLHVETIYWFSASSFMWALLWTLAAWLGVASAVEGTSRGGWWAAMLGAALAPACSAIGLLAGPLAALHVLASGRSKDWRGRALGLAPLAGTGLYLAVCILVRHHAYVLHGIEHKADPASGLLATARASIEVLVPGLFGLPHLGQRWSDDLILGLFGTGFGISLLWARRSRANRPLVLGGLALIVGGYWLTFSARPGAGPLVQRYHLFPHVGLVLWLACLLRPGLARLEGRPLVSPATTLGLALLILAPHVREIHRRGAWYRYPDQGKTLAALDHLGEICRARRITRAQAIAALDPIWRAWFPFEAEVFNVLEMLPTWVESPGLPDPLVRPTLLAALTPAERGLLCGGMDATRHVRPAADLGTTGPIMAGRLVRSLRVQARADRLVSLGWPSYLEYEMPRVASEPTGGPSIPEGRAGAEARALCVPGGARGETVEVWWAGDDLRWPEVRRARWRIDPTRLGQDCVVPLDQLPHWRTTEARRIRIVFRSPGPINVGTPRLLW